MIILDNLGFLIVRCVILGCIIFTMLGVDIDKETLVICFMAILGFIVSNVWRPAPKKINSVSMEFQSCCPRCNKFYVSSVTLPENEDLSKIQYLVDRMVCSDCSDEIDNEV